MKLKKLQIQRIFEYYQTESASKRNFQAFLKTKTDHLIEVSIDWFSGAPQQRCSNNEERNRVDLNFPGEVEARAQANAFNPNNDIAIKALEIIFQDCKNLRKLIVGDRRRYLTNSVCPSVAALNIVPNPSITELRVRFDKSSFSDSLFEKLMIACPNVKNLFAFEIDQKLLEYCARKLIQIESIFAFSLKVDRLPNELVKLNKLNSINFCECIVNNHPEMSAMKSNEQKQTVLKMLI